MTTNDTPGWVERLAARLTETTSDPAAEDAVTGSQAPAWARVQADRAAGREPDAEDVRKARVRAVRPRTEFERRVLDRLGHDPGNGPTAA